MKKRTFEKELPEGYEEAMVIDAKDKKTVIIFNVISVIMAVAAIAAAAVIIDPFQNADGYKPIRMMLFFLCSFPYIVLHELTHGLAYKLLTGEKLTFGITLSVAYCGVPHIYVYRKQAIISALAPFTVFTLIFIILMILLPDVWDKFYVAILFSVHFSGCIGDLYNTLLYFTKLRDPSILTQDTGPKQTFYRKTK